MAYCTIIFALLSFASICDTTLLWRINVNPPAYLLGTIHLPYTYIWPSLSDTVKSAFSNSTHFLPEFDMTNFFTFTRFRMCMNPHMSSNPNSGRPPPPPVVPNQRAPEPSILDVYLTLEARRLKKTVQSLESVEMYCEFTKFQVDSLISNSTSNGAQMPIPNEKDYDQVKHVYQCDLNYPGELFPPPPPASQMVNNPSFKLQQSLNTIVERRDSNMAQTIDNLLKEGSPDKRFFFAVGFIHLMGADGIITKLRRDYQYSITRLCTDPPESRYPLRCEGPSWCDLMPGL